MLKVNLYHRRCICCTYI